MRLGFGKVHGGAFIMALIVKNNMDSVNALKNLSKNTEAMHKDLKKLAQGEKITSAGDGASEYAISERMRVQVKSLDQDDQNAQNGISILNVAAGAVDSTISVLRTMKEKAIDAANDSNSNADREIIQKAIDDAISQIDDNALVGYNGINMLDGMHNDGVVSGGTYTHFTNSALSEDTTANTALTALMSRSGESLGIRETDVLTISWVQNGETSTKTISPLTYTYTKDMRDPTDPFALPDIRTFTEPLYLEKIFENIADDDDNIPPFSLSSTGAYIGTDQAGEEVSTVDGRNAITLKADNPGIAGQIAGVTFGIYDGSGKPREAANKFLNEFTETIQAQNQSDDNALVLQIGTRANQNLKVGFIDMRASALGLTSITSPKQNLSVSTQANAAAAINVLDNALQKVLNQQTKIGAETSRLEYTSANLVMNSENTQAAESVIRDADMAREQTAYARDSILTQAAQAMLAQSNQNSSSVLSLLQ